jgi:hypothetical protein
MHTSLGSSRLYTAGVTAGGSSRTAVANVTFRMPGPAVEVGTDDGNGRTAVGLAFSSGALTVPPGASGLLRAVELRTDAPVRTTCVANVTVVAPAPREFVRVLLVNFFNNGADATAWRSLPLPAPFAVAGGSQVAVSHSCGGQFVHRRRAPGQRRRRRRAARGHVCGVSGRVVR